MNIAATRRAALGALAAALTGALIILATTRATTSPERAANTARPRQDVADVSVQGASVTARRVYPNTRMRLEIPPPEAVARITSAQALNAVESGGHVPDSTKTPDVQLVSYSNDSNGDIQADGSVKLLYQNVLAWAVTYHDIPFPAGELRPGRTGPRWIVNNDYVVIVDASSGKVLFSFNDLPA